MIHIVYKTTNTTNGKFYIGKHSTDNIDDGYIGSGVILSLAVKKYGKDKFVREVIKEFGDEASAYQFERELIEAIGLDPTKCYNACKGGVGFWKGMTHTPEARAKISASNTGKRHSPEAREKMSLSRLGKPISEEAKVKLKEANLGKTHSDDTKAKISASNTGKTRSAEFCANASERMKGRPSPRRGVVLSEETRSKMSLAKRGRKVSQETKEALRLAAIGLKNAGYGKIWITDGKTNSRIGKDDIIPDGWRRGRSLRPYQINKGK